MKDEENYVSFEVARLLKERGFNWACKHRHVYRPDGELRQVTWTVDNKRLDEHEFLRGCCVAPTQGMAMKWLREKYCLSINIKGHGVDTGCESTDIFAYYVEVVNMRTLTLEWWYKNEVKTYEDAVEAALKYALENLIEEAEG